VKAGYTLIFVYYELFPFLLVWGSTFILFQKWKKYREERGMFQGKKEIISLFSKIRNYFISLSFSNMLEISPRLFFFIGLAGILSFTLL